MKVYDMNIIKSGSLCRYAVSTRILKGSTIFFGACNVFGLVCALAFISISIRFVSFLLLKISVLHPPPPKSANKYVHFKIDSQFDISKLNLSIEEWQWLVIGNIEHQEHLIARQIVKSDIPVGKQEKAKEKSEKRTYKSGWLSSQLFYLFRAIETPRKHCAILKNQNI